MAHWTESFEKNESTLEEALNNLGCNFSIKEILKLRISSLVFDEKASREQLIQLTSKIDAINMHYGYKRSTSYTIRYKDADTIEYVEAPDSEAEEITRSEQMLMNKARCLALIETSSENDDALHILALVHLTDILNTIKEQSELVHLSKCPMLIKMVRIGKLSIKDTIDLSYTYDYSEDTINIFRY